MPGRSVSRRRSRRGLAGGALALSLALAGCSQSSDPPTWEDAEENLEPGEVSTIQQNFQTSCEEANADADGSGDVPSYCECSYEELREFYGSSLDDFKDAESALRDDPTAINNPGVIPTEVVDALNGCVDQHLG